MYMYILIVNHARESRGDGGWEKKYMEKEVENCHEREPRDEAHETERA